jgi:V/A-type H+-transporting ATPase subunit D
MMHMPPGRSGRLWLHRRLGIARRALEVLEQKVRALREEERRLGFLTERAEHAWQTAWEEAETWYLRAMLLGGEIQVDLVDAATVDSAEVDIRWRSTMGATYPFEASCTLPEPVAVAELGRSAALPFATDAYRRALMAATQHAAAKRAEAVVRAELSDTQRRLSAVRHGWIPRLEAARQQLELQLAEREREDMVSSKWAADRDLGAA